jgi:VanZ family protein
MPPWNLRASLRIGLYACAATIAVLAFSPLEATAVTGSDKLNHILAFFVLSALAAGAYPRWGGRAPGWALLLGYGLLIEIVQHFLPFRRFSWADLGADALGILLFAVGVRLAPGKGRSARRQGKPQRRT